MDVIDKNIVESYATLLRGLTQSNKLKLIERLADSLDDEPAKLDQAFYRSFGAFSSDRSADQIIQEIKSSRNFRKREIEF